MTKCILITGSTGFIGKALINQLLDQCHIKAPVRNKHVNMDDRVDQFLLSSPLEEVDWVPLLDNVDTVIHLAARVHVMKDTVADPLESFRRTNTAGSLNLCRQASKAGVRRFIYLSSIKVNGERTLDGALFTHQDNNVPTDPYGLSKYEAEQGLMKIADSTGIEIVIIRPPLVYGPGVKANFKSMMNCLHKGVPLPFGLVNNKRSLVALDNVIDLIVTCIDHPAAKNEIFLISDSEDLSTKELLQRMALALGKRSFLLPIPTKLINLFFACIGRQDMIVRLCGSLQVDISHTKNILGWTPPYSTDQSLKKTADAYLKNSE